MKPRYLVPLLVSLWLLVSLRGDLAAKLPLSEEELAFLRAHPVWRMAGANSPPFQWLDEDGELQGLAREYRRIIEERLGIRLEVVPAKTWDASLEQLRRGECDVSLLTADTPARREFLLFTNSLLDLPLVVIARRGAPSVSEIDDLADRQVAVARNWPIHEKLEREHRKIRVLPRDDVGSAISAVALGDADAYVGDLASATDAIDRLGVRNLKIAGQTSYVFPFRVGVRKDWPEAVALLDKAIASITPAEHQAIRRRWLAQLDSGWTLRRVLQFAIPTAVGLVVITLLIMNRRLAAEVRRRRHTEAALRESEERWSFALEGSLDGVWDWDLSSNEVFFSRRFQAMLGFSSGELQGNFDAWQSRLHPKDAGAVLDAVEAHLRGETEIYEKEHRLRARDGTYRWILSRGRVVSRDEDGAPIRMVGTQSDITERKQLDFAVQARLEETVRARTEELERAQRELRQITDNIPGAVYQFVKKTDGSFAFTFCSEGMETMVGVSCEDAVRDVNTVWAVIHPEDLAELVKKANHSAETLTDYVQDLRIRQPNGRFWWIQAEAAPQRQPDGSTVWNGNIMEITERKNLEEELAKAKQVADSANRAKSAFLANMSHEIRTPLNAILGFSQLLLRDRALTTAQRNHLETVARSGEHLLALINDILEISKIEAGRVILQPGNFDLPAMLGDLDRLFRMRAEAKGLRLEITADPDLPQFVKADEGKLRQILINLVSNAVKFTERGSVTVRLSCGPAEAGNLPLRGSVEDTGPGIDPNDLPKLFAQFEQTETGRRAGVGTGLGLAISREFVRLMGGDIKVRSQVGAGTTFEFDLLVEEALDGAPEKVERGRVVRLRPPHLGLRVLIADDKAENRELLEQLLKPVGFETRSVDNGQKAIEVFSEWRPQVGLFDLRMPDVDGFEAIRAIRKLPHGRRAPIIAVTASAFEENRRDVIAAGGDDFIGKPFRESDLFEKIGRLTGAEFEYEIEPPAHESPCDRPPLAAEEIARAIPAEMRRQLAQSAMRADYDAMLATLALLEKDAPDVAGELRKRVECFEYQTLIDLTPEQTLKQ